MSSPQRKSDEFGEQDVFDFGDDGDDDGLISEEDTDDASEGEKDKKEERYTEIKEQMYQDKLSQLKKQLSMLKDGSLPEYQKKLKKIEFQYQERQRLNEIWYTYECENIEREYIREKKQAAIEFEERKTQLKENLIQELEDKKKQVEFERNTMELMGDPAEPKPVPTRKLRPRAHDPIQTLPEKRRKASPVSQLKYCLCDDDIDDDLAIISKISGRPLPKKSLTSSLQSAAATAAAAQSEIIYDARIDDGRLYYEKKWFHRGQPIFVESKEFGKVSAVVSAVGTAEIWLRKIVDNTKLRIGIRDIQRGKYIMRKRTS